jgi:hypothetical protein
MNEHELFSNSIYEEQTHTAERELSSFILCSNGLVRSKGGDAFDERLARRVGTHGQLASIGNARLARCYHRDVASTR